ncbi:carbon-nitrogen hydrolase [Geopyxis carbonaria]|nr:carbon-nitrogen hydrolase [Geopyxis carbonaria]
MLPRLLRPLTTIATTSIRPLTPLSRLTSLTRTMTTPAPNPLLAPTKLALIQLASTADKSSNLERAATFVKSAAQAGASIVVLPECFNSPYGCEHFPRYAEPIPRPGMPPASVSALASPSFRALSTLAAAAKVHLVAGSIPESVKIEGDTKYYNTCMVFSPAGELLATHRKIHLFDIDIPGKIKFRESDVLSPGHAPTLVDIPGVGKLGVAICYDIRFPELAMMAARRGAFAMVYPAAFNMTTGPLHWELLARARACDNQVYVAMCSPARNEEGEGYVAWGETMVVDPSGVVVEKLAGEEGTVLVELVPERVKEVRAGIPVTTQRRWDVYADVSRVPPMEEPKE